MQQCVNEAETDSYPLFCALLAGVTVTVVSAYTSYYHGSCVFVSL